MSRHELKAEVTGSIWKIETTIGQALDKEHTVLIIESMKMEIPVLGLVPDITPSWMTEDNGLWVNNKTIMVDVLSDFIQNWLEDNLSPKLFEQMEKTLSELPTKEDFEKNTIFLFNKMIETRISSFEDQLSKFETI